MLMVYMAVDIPVDISNSYFCHLYIYIVVDCHTNCSYCNTTVIDVLVYVSSYSKHMPSKCKNTVRYLLC